MIELLRALLAAALLLGPLAWLHRRSALPAGWHPLLVLCAAMLTVLMAGIAGSLDVGLVIVVVVGSVSLVWELVRHGRNVLATLREPTAVLLALSAAAAGYLLHDSLFTHYDNFSHWALVLRIMLQTHELPGAAEGLVGFPTYPLGGASFAWLVNRLVGSSEGVAMWGQTLLVSACALPVVTAAGRRWMVGSVLYAVGGLVLLTHATQPSSLLVDGLVAGVGAALLLLVLLERKALIAQPWVLGVLGAALVSIKASGVFFVAITSLLALLLIGGLLVSALRDRRNPGEGPVTGPSALTRLWSVGAWAVALGLPWLIRWLWDSHVERVFPDAATSKHSGSPDQFEDILEQKTPEDIRAILDLLGRAILNDWQLWALLVAIVIAVLLLGRSAAVSAVDRWRLLITAFLVTVLWEISLAGTYLLSMPVREALHLAGIGRYQGTLHIVLAILVLMTVARWAAAVKDFRSALGSVVAAVLAAALVLPLTNLSALVQSSAYTRRGLEHALAGLDPAPSQQVCLLQKSNDSGYRGWMTRYLLLHSNVRGVVLPESAQDLQKWVDGCAIIVLADSREHTIDLVKQAGFTVNDHAALPQVVTR